MQTTDTSSGSEQWVSRHLQQHLQGLCRVLSLEWAFICPASLAVTLMAAHQMLMQPMVQWSNGSMVQPVQPLIQLSKLTMGLPHWQVNATDHSTLQPLTALDPLWRQNVSSLAPFPIQSPIHATHLRLPFTPPIHISHSHHPFTSPIHASHSRLPFSSPIHASHSGLPFTSPISNSRLPLMSNYSRLASLPMEILHSPGDASHLSCTAYTFAHQKSAWTGKCDPAPSSPWERVQQHQSTQHLMSHLWGIHTEPSTSSTCPFARGVPSCKHQNNSGRGQLDGCSWR